jgi:hypothetical protein
MPAAAVASFTPGIGGMSGTWVGARGETAVDIRQNPNKRQDQIKQKSHGWIYSGHPNLSCKSFLQVFLLGLSTSGASRRTWPESIRPCRS